MGRAAVPINGSSRKIRGKLKRKGVNVSSDTINRDIRSLGYKYGSRPLSQGLTEVQKKKRVSFALKWEELKWDTSRLVFTYEKLFDTKDHRKKMWMAPGKKPAKRQRVRWAPKCHVWGAVGVGYRKLVVLSSNSITCVSNTLKKVQFPPNCIFQQDGATSHTAKESKAYLEKTEMTLLPNWPPNSPDLSPIENVWSMVQELVDEYTSSNKEDLIKSVYIDDSVLSCDARLKACVANKGEKVKKL